MSRRSKIAARAFAWVLFFLSPFILSLVYTGCGSDKSETHTAVRAGSTRATNAASARDDVVNAQPDAVETPQVAAMSRLVSEAEPPREVTYEEAEEVYLNRDYESAKELFVLYTEQKSENPWGFYMLGLSAWKAGDPGLAEKAFERSLALDAKHVKSYLNLSRVLLDIHRPDEALEKIEAAVALEPSSNDAYRLKGRALRQKGEVGDAIRAYQYALVLDPDDAWSMNNLGLILIESELFERAIPALARAVEIEGDVPAFWNNLGMALEGTGRFREAENAYVAALDVDASYFKASMNAARIAAVVESSDVQPLDLAVLAQAFTEEISAWKEEFARAALDESQVAEAAPVVSTPADSVVVRGNPMADGEERP